MSFENIQENLEGIQNKIVQSKERCKILEEQQKNQQEQMTMLENKHKTLLEENIALKASLEKIANDEQFELDAESKRITEEAQNEDSNTTSNSNVKPSDISQRPIKKARRLPPARQKNSDPFRAHTYHPKNKVNINSIPIQNNTQKPKEDFEFVSASPKSNIVPKQFVRSEHRIKSVNPNTSQ